MSHFYTLIGSYTRLCCELRGSCSNQLLHKNASCTKRWCSGFALYGFHFIKWSIISDERPHCMRIEWSILQQRLHIFQWAVEHQKFPLSNSWFLGPTTVRSQTTSRSLQPFLQGSSMCPTDYRQTTCDICAMHAMRPNKNYKPYAMHLRCLSCHNYGDWLWWLC